MRLATIKPGQAYPKPKDANGRPMPPFELDVSPPMPVGRFYRPKPMTVSVRFGVTAYKRAKGPNRVYARIVPGLYGMPAADAAWLVGCLRAACADGAPRYTRAQATGQARAAKGTAAGRLVDDPAYVIVAGYDDRAEPARAVYAVAPVAAVAKMADDLEAAIAWAKANRADTYENYAWAEYGRTPPAEDDGYRAARFSADDGKSWHGLPPGVSV